MAKNSIHAIPLETFLSSALLTAFQPINPLGLDQACFLIRIVNLGTTPIIISFDGANDNEQLKTLDTLELYGGEGSSSPQGNCALWAKGQIIYARGTAGTGNITLSGYYTPVNS